MANKAKQKKPSPPSPGSAVSQPASIPAGNSWADIFAIDARSLGLFRIGLGSFVLLDLLMRSADLSAFYTDEGVLPRLSRILLYDLSDTSGQKYWLSLHLISGGVWFQALAFIVAGIFAFSLMVGYRTRRAAIASYLLLCSLHSRNPLILDGGDTLMRVLLFWSLFLPLNARFSVDRWLRPEPAAPLQVRCIASFALLTQIGFVYVFGAILKSDPIWTSEYSALYYALSLRCFATSFGHALLAYPALLKSLTFLAWWLEMLGPLLLLSPYGAGWPRLFVVVAFCGFHLGTAATLHLSLFPFIGCLAWVVFLPSCVWDETRWPGRWIVPGCRRAIRPFRGWVEQFVSRSARFTTRPEQSDYHPGWISTVIVAFLWIYVFVWNVREVRPNEWTKVMPVSWNVVGRLSRLDQEWRLFAPYPIKDDGWYVMKGVLRDGTEVNLWRPGQPLPWTEPDSVAATYANRRWRKYLMNLWQMDHAAFRQFLAVWLASRWQDEHAGKQPARLVDRVEIYFQLVRTPLPGQPRPKPTRETLIILPIGQ